MKILIVEDESKLRENIKTFLELDNNIVETAEDFIKAEDKISSFKYDCVLVDITIPNGNGLNLIKTLKNYNPAVGIIIISAKNSIDDKVLGLDLGADDYLPKPFHLSELNARIKALYRRKNFNAEKNIIFNEIEVRIDEHIVSINKKEIELTSKEYDLLIYFLANKNRVVSKNSIAEHLWGDYMESTDSLDFIYTHIKNLRKKMLENGSQDYIKTIYGIGYKFKTEL